MLASLRRFKRRETLRIAYGDIVRNQPVETVTRQISYLADAIVEAALDFARRHLNEQYGTPLRADGERSRFVVLGLGKLGGVELNYSSDIDLIFLYEQDGQTDARRTVSNQEYFERLSKEVIRLLTEPTDLGAAYRVDLRLRPEGSRGPLCTELRQHAVVLRRERPHLGAAGVRQGPADRRRSRAWAAICSRGSSRGFIAAISASPTSRASSRSSAASSSAPKAKAATCGT